jgi:alkyl hydroperoxide reductase subunit AhpC
VQNIYSDDEMIQQMLDDEAACGDEVHEHLAIIASFQKMLDEDEATLWRFKAGKKKVGASTEVGGS